MADLSQFSDADLARMQGLASLQAMPDDQLHALAGPQQPGPGTSLADRLAPKLTAAKDAASGLSAPGVLGGTTDAALGTMSMGLNDKMRGIAHALVGSGMGADQSFSDLYHQGLATSRNEATDFAAAHPTASNFGSGMGIAASGALLGPASTPETLLGKIAQGAKYGAGYGAAGGLGSTNDESLGQDLTAMGKGAGVGAFVGGLLPPVVSAASRAVEPVVNYFNPNAYTNKASDLIAKAMRQDAQAGGPTPDDITQAIRNAKFGNLTPTMYEAGGENLKALGGQITRTPGPGRQAAMDFLTQRDQGAGPRIVSTIDQNIAQGSAYDAGKTLMQMRQTAAAPLYDKAYSMPPLNPDVMDPVRGDIGKLLARPSMKGAVKGALSLASEEGENPASLGITFNEAGDPAFQGVPSWKTLDYIKRGLDDVVEGARDNITGRLDNAGRLANNTRMSFLSAVDQGNPAYAEARNAWSGPTQAMSAMDMGSKFRNMRPEAIADYVSSASPADKAFFKIGAADALRTQVTKTGDAGNEALALAKNDYLKQQLRPLFDSDQAYNSFMSNIDAEKNAFRATSKMIGNSPTAARMAQDHEEGGGGVMGPLFQTMISGMAHEPASAGINAWRTIAALLKPGPASPKVLNAAAPLLFTDSPQAMAQTLGHASRPTVPGLLPAANVPLAGLVGHYGARLPWPGIAPLSLAPTMPSQ